MFLVNLPIGVVVMGVLAFAMPSRFNEKRHRIDYLGGVLLAVGTTAIVYWGYHLLDPSGPDLITFALPVLALVAISQFIMVERRAQEPIVPLRLFAISTVSIVSAVSLVAGTVTLGMFFYFALYMQTLTGLSPAEVGFLFLPASLTSMVVSIVAGRVIAATGRYKWMPVVAMGIGGLLMLGFVITNQHTPIWVLAVMMAVFGVSMGLQFQVLIVAIQAAAPLQDIGAVTSLITQARTLGASLGLALNGAVMIWALNRQTAELPTDASALLPDGLNGLSPHLASSLPAAIRELVLDHYSSGFNVVFIWVAALYFVAMGLTLLLEDKEIPKRV